MNYKTLAKGRDWMTPNEKAIHRRVVYRIRRIMKKCGVEETMLLIFRIEDVAIAHLLVRRLEEKMNAFPEENEKPMPLSTLIDAINKARERLHKAMQHLEDYCQKAGSPIDGGLADTLKPIITKAERILATNETIKTRKTPEIHNNS